MIIFPPFVSCSPIPNKTIIISSSISIRGSVSSSVSGAGPSDSLDMQI